MLLLVNVMVITTQTKQHFEISKNFEKFFLAFPYLPTNCLLRIFWRPKNCYPPKLVIIPICLPSLDKF